MTVLPLAEAVETMCPDADLLRGDAPLKGIPPVPDTSSRFACSGRVSRSGGKIHTQNVLGGTFCVSEPVLNTSSAEPSQIPWEPPATARVPEGSSYWLGEDDGYCRLIHADGRRCQGIRTREDGLCPPHAGKSKILDDPAGYARKGNAGKARIRERHALLAAHGVNPRRAAREAAIRRTDAVVRALVDAPLDDQGLSTMQRQRAVLGMLDAVFPLAQVTAEIELPASAEQVEAMGWSDMQALAQRMLPEG